VALWDARLQRLLLARDQLGLVPLYYAADGRRLAAASSLPGLVALPGLAATWDPAALEAFVTFGLVPPPFTVYAGIRQLGPGELALWEDGRLRTQRYWQLTFPERRLTRADLPRLVREQLLEALRLRQAGMVSGLLLSGGLDAAALLALAAADHRLPARAYTAVFADGDAELATAAAHATSAGVEHATVSASPDWPAALDRLLAAHGGPVGGPGTAALQLAAIRARGEVDVLLAGVGGDEIFGGSAPARALERVRRYRALPALAREGAQIWARLAPAGRGARLRRLVESERLAPLEMYARAVSHVLPEEREALFTPETLAVLGEARPWDTLGGLFAEAASAGGTDPADTIHYVELTLRLPALATAARAAAEGLDLRLPLADHRIAQFVASVPPPLRGNASERQLLLRAALAELLPPATLRTPHASPVPPPRVWAAWLDEALTPARLAAHGFFRREIVVRLMKEHQSGTRDHAARLWAIALVTRWLERQPVAVPAAERAAG
jgi:asparagine synthase (glutamine-hydrolysing)